MKIPIFVIALLSFMGLTSLCILVIYSYLVQDFLTMLMSVLAIIAFSLLTRLSLWSLKEDRIAEHREQIIKEVNEHQFFIARWRKYSFRERIRIDRGGKTIMRGDYS